MHEIQKQLGQVQRLARVLLILGPVLGWLSIVMLLALALGALDYLLLLPAWLRLVMGIGAILLLGTWLSLRIYYALRVKVDPTWLALRAERMYPQLGGVLASGVEFAAAADAQALDPARAMSPRTAAMAQQSIGRAMQLTSGVRLLRLIDPTPTIRLGVITLIITAIMASLAIAMPDTFWLGARRWVTPLADVHWPKRTAIQSLMTQAHWPSDTPLPLRARVTQGHKANMRIEVAHRLIDAQGNPGRWQTDLMNDQSPALQTAAAAEASVEAASPDNSDAPQATEGDFERVISTFTPADPGTPGTPAPGNSAARRASNSGGASFSAIEYRFHSYDDQTQTQRIDLIDRPAIQSLTAAITPPDYAQGIIQPQTLALDQTPGQSITLRSLAGSQIVLSIRLNKPLPVESLLDAMALFPGLAQARQQPSVVISPNAMSEEGMTRELEVRVVLDHPWQSGVHLVDGYGLTSLSQRVYRFEPIDDLPPGVTMLQPAADESATAKAKINLAAIMNDDVASTWLSLHMKRQAQQPSAAGQTGDDAAALTSGQLHRVTGRSGSLEATHELDLATLELQAGQVIELWALGQDVYMHEGTARQPVRSAVRRITIIDPAAMAARLSQELETIRQQALRLEAQQQALIENKARLSTAQQAGAQQQISDRLKIQQNIAEHLTKQMRANDLEDAQLAQLLDQVTGHLQRASSASQQAKSNLDKAMGQAASQQNPGASQQQGSSSQDASQSAGQSGTQNGSQENATQQSSRDASQGEAKDAATADANDDAKAEAQDPSKDEAGDGQQAGAQDGAQRDAQAQASAQRDGQQMPSNQAESQSSQQGQSQQAGQSQSDQQDGQQQAGQQQSSQQQSGQQQAGAQSQQSGQQGQQQSGQQQAGQQQAGQQQSGQQQAGQQPQQQSPSQARQQAQAQQQETAKELSELVSLLDRGRDAMALQLQLQEMARQQAELARKTRELLPETLGKRPEQLTDEQKKQLEALARQQQAMQQQAQAMQQKMQSAAQQMAQEGSSPTQQAAAQALAQAAKTASQQGLSQSMSQSAQSLEQNQLASAAAQQQQASQTLQDMLDQMNNQQAMAQEILRRQMQKMAQALQRLIQQQKEQVEAVEPMHKQGRLAQMDSPAQTLRQNTAAVAQEMQGSSELAQAQQELSQATDAQAQAIESLRKQQPQETRAAQQQSLAHMENALRRIEEQQQQQAQNQDDEKRKELRAQYEALAKAQGKLREETDALAQQAPLDRRQRAQAAALGTKESALQEEMRTLGEQLADLVVFEHIHREIDQLAGDAATRLKQGQADDAATTNQEQVETLLKQLAAALVKPPGQQEEFSSGGGGGGGGQQGGGQAQQPLVPPLAELRLLRDVQKSLHQHTRQFHDALVAQANQDNSKAISPAQRQTIINLSRKQRDLAELGDKLISQMRSRQPAPAPDNTPPQEPTP